MAEKKKSGKALWWIVGIGGALLLLGSLGGSDDEDESEQEEEGAPEETNTDDATEEEKLQPLSSANFQVTLNKPPEEVGKKATVEEVAAAIQPFFLDVPATTATGKKIVEAAASYVNEGGTGNSCFDWVEKVYNKVGFSSNNKTVKKIWKSSQYGGTEGQFLPVAKLGIVQPGDWLYIHNKNPYDSKGNHSVIFLRWEDMTRSKATVANTRGAGKPGKVEVRDISQAPIAFIMRAVESQAMAGLSGYNAPGYLPLPNEYGIRSFASSYLQGFRVAEIPFLAGEDPDAGKTPAQIACEQRNWERVQDTWEGCFGVCYGVVPPPCDRQGRSVGRFPPSGVSGMVYGVVPPPNKRR